MSQSDYRAFGGFHVSGGSAQDQREITLGIIQ